MLTEQNLKIGTDYQCWSPTKMCFTKVVYLGKYIEPGKENTIFKFRNPLNLNELWLSNLINITVL